MDTIVRDRIVYTLTDCGVLALAPAKQTALASKLTEDGFTAEDVAKVWRICRHNTKNQQEAASAMAALLKEEPADIRRVLATGREADRYPGEGQMRQSRKEWQPETDPIRAARMAYALVVADRKTHAQAAWEIGCDVARIPAMIDHGRTLSAPDVKPNQNTKELDVEGQRKRIAEFRKMCRGNQLPIPQSMLDTIEKVNRTPYR